MKFPVEMILRDPFSILKQPLLEEWFRRGWDRWVYTDGTRVVSSNPNQLELFDTTKYQKYDRFGRPLKHFADDFHEGKS